jgi:hypothetical protein
MTEGRVVPGNAPLRTLQANPAAAADPALPVRQRRPLEGEAPKALRGGAYLSMRPMSGPLMSASMSTRISMRSPTLAMPVM